ncbi:MAG: hypothetical protein RLZZ94_908 [Bacteroidota bacterium]
MKKVLLSSIISVVILVAVAGVFIYYQYYRNESTSLYEAIPSDVAWVISVDPTTGDLKRLANTGFFNNHDSIAVLDDWYKSLISLDSAVVKNQALRSIFKTYPLVVSGHVTGPNTFSEIYYLRLNNANPDGEADQLVMGILGKKVKKQTRNYNGTEIREVRLDSARMFTWSVSKGVFIGSFTPYLVEDALRQQKYIKSSSPAVKLMSFVDTNKKNLVIGIHYNGFHKWVLTQLNTLSGLKLEPLQRVGEWSIAKLNIKSDCITFQGTTIVDGSNQFLSLFKDQKSVPLNVFKILPSRTAAVVAWGISSPSVWLDDFAEYLQENNGNTSSEKNKIYFQDWIGNEISLIVTEPVSNNSDNNYFAAVAVNNVTLCQKKMLEVSEMGTGSKPLEESYNGIAIRKLKKNDLIPSVLGPLFSKLNGSYYCIINNYFVASNQVAALRGFINDNKNKNLLIDQNRFKAITNTVHPFGNLYFYAGFPQSEKIFKSIAAPGWLDWLTQYGNKVKGWNGLALNIGSSNGVFNTTGCLSYFNNVSQGPHAIWDYKCDTTIIAGPFAPKADHDMFFVQDANLALSAVGKDGALKWKKSLDSEINGEIKTVDFYNNGSVQYVFNTLSKIYMLDSLGDNVGNYPIQLPDTATTGIGVFQLNYNTSAQLFICCRNMAVYGYELSGIPLINYQTVTLTSTVKTPPMLSVYGAKRYITVVDVAGICYFITPLGEKKFRLDETIGKPTSNRIFAAKDTSSLFVWETSGGILKNAKGSGGSVTYFKPENESIKDVVLSRKNSKTYFAGSDGDSIHVFNSDGTKKSGSKLPSNVVVKDLTVLMDYDDVYISYRDAETNNFYLIDGSGRVCKGFPIQGYTAAKDISSTNLEFIFKSGTNSFSLYQIE